MKLKKYSVGMMLLTGVLAGVNAQAQSTITELLKSKTPAIKNGREHPYYNYKHSFIKSYELTFANGAKVLVRADDTRKDVLMTAVSPGGASLVDDQDFQSAIHAGDIIGNSGLG